MQELDDIGLLREYVKHGSEEAFAALVSRHINKVYSVALRHVGNANQAEEITQAVFVILARQASRLGEKVIIQGWLYQTARLTAVTFIRSQIRRSRREHEAFMQTHLNENETEVWKQITPLLDNAMAELRNKDKNAIVLRFFEGKDLKQVGAALGVSESAATKRVHHALEKLRRYFSKHGMTSTTAIIAGAISANSVQAAPAALAQTVTAVAIAKGATTANSTLILIKGTLKLMAWTKTKSVIAASAVVLFGTGAGMVAVQAVRAASAAAGPDIQGAWEGVANVGIGARPGENARSRVVLKIYKTNNVYNATADEIDEAIKDVPFSKALYDFPTLRLEAEPWADRKATLNAAATELTIPDGTNLIVLKRTTTPDTVQEPLRESDFAPRHGSDLQGYWSWAANGMRSDLKIAEQKDGNFRAEMDVPAMAVNKNPILVTYNRPTVKLQAADGWVTCQGEINDMGTEIKGSVIFFGGYLVPATFKRADYKTEPAIAESDYSYNSKSDLQGHWKANAKVGLWKKFPVALDVAKLPDGNFSVMLVEPVSLGWHDAPFFASIFGMDYPVPSSGFRHELADVHLEWKLFNAFFDGKLANGKLAGKLRTGDDSFSLTFERSPAQ